MGPLGGMSIMAWLNLFSLIRAIRERKPLVFDKGDAMWGALACLMDAFVIGGAIFVLYASNYLGWGLFMLIYPIFGIISSGYGGSHYDAELQEWGRRRNKEVSERLRSSSRRAIK